MAKVLRILAGPAARQRLAEQGLQPADVGLIPAAAGGPKGPGAQRPGSLPVWRVAHAQPAARPPRGRQHRGLAHGHGRRARMRTPTPPSVTWPRPVTQRYDTPPGEKRPRPDHVSERFGDILTVWFAGRESEVLSHPRWRLHVVTSRGRHPLLRHEGRWRTPAGYAGAFASNLVHRTGLGHWLDRVVFSDGRSPLPLPLADFPTQRVELSATICALRCSPAARSRSGYEPSRTPGAPPGALTGTAVSPTTTCTSTTARCWLPRRRWCSTPFPAPCRARLARQGP